MATYPDVIGLYCVQRFKGKTGGAWEQETWQIGVRLAVVAQGNLPGLDAGNVTMPARTVADQFGTQSLPDGNIQFGFSDTSATSPITDADQADIIAKFIGFQTSNRANQSSEYVWESTRIYPFFADGKSATAPTIFTPTNVNLQPSGGAMLPPDTALGVSYKSVVRGPSGRGRVFMGGIPQAVLATTGLVGSTAQAQFGGRFKGLLDGFRGINASITGARYCPVIWHRGTNTGAVIAQVRVDDELDTQRRRDQQRASVWLSYPLA